MWAQGIADRPIYFETHGDRARPAVFMGPHFYATRQEPDEFFTHAWIEQLAPDFFLILADYPRGMGRTPHPQGASFTAEEAALEYELIADAAGVERFGWVGYSFGGAMGLQVACRSQRVTALAIGGWPPLNAPHQLMTELSRATAESPPTLPALIDPGVLWSAAGFYASLLAWPEREELAKLRMPRLAFMGDRDAGEGSALALPLAGNLRASEQELRAMGWPVQWLEGCDHITALAPEIVIAPVAQFLRSALLK